MRSASCARERLLDRLDWLGLLAVAAARRVPYGRVPYGRVIGIDLWLHRDLGGNGAAAMVDNARREGVADCVEARTADMRALALPDASSDRVISRQAIHNIADAAGRDRAIAEAIRVTRPGGAAGHRGHPPPAALWWSAAGGRIKVGFRRGVVDWVFTLLSVGGIRPGVLTARRGLV